MTIRKYRYDKNLGKMVEVMNDLRAPRKTPYVIDDIKPYQVIGPEYGKVIGSRSQHREYLRKHDLIEVGNEKKYFLPDDKK
jgi:hypothetical protein